MGCFLGCFGGAKVHKRRKQGIKRSSAQVQGNRVQNVQQESVSIAEPTITETPQTNLVSELQSKPTVEEEQLSPSPRKRVTFNSNITTYDHVSVHESIDSLPHCKKNVAKENQEDLKTTSPSRSLSKNDSSVISSVGSYPPNHRYHNARESDDEAEEYDSDSDDFDNLDDDDEDDYDEYDEDNDGRISCREVWSESVLTASMDSRTEHTNEDVKAFGTKADNARDRSDYLNSVLKPIENITRWKAVKSKRKSDLPKKENQEIAVDASLSKWLGSTEETFKKTSFSGLDTVTSGKTMT